ncbi:MBL fold metallo-hydrolase [Nocardia beijingensis]
MSINNVENPRRRRWGRPDLARLADRFDVPAAGNGLSVTFLGVSTLLVSDGESAIMTDGFFTRPALASVLFGRLRPHDKRIRDALQRVDVSTLDAVIPVHTHYDHALDAAVVARLTNAPVAGGPSARHIAVGGGLTDSQIIDASAGQTIELGNYDLTLYESHHCPPDRWPGRITAPVVPPTRVSSYKCGEAWSVHVRHRPTDQSMLINGSAGASPGALAGVQADVVYLGVAQLVRQTADYINDYWLQAVLSVGARRVVLVHWDDFTQPLDKPIRALPYLVDDLDACLHVLTDLGRATGVSIHLPQLWKRENPWA